MRRLSVVLLAALVLAGSAAASVRHCRDGARQTGTAYTPEAPVVDSISGGPWNTSQGDPSAGSAYPTRTCCRVHPGRRETTLGGVSEPNVAVYPAASGDACPTRAASPGRRAR